LPLAIIEAKDNNHSIDAGMQQGLNYGEILDIPFVYSSNGDGFIEHDRTKSEGQVERELTLDEFPSPEELWNRYKTLKGITEEQEKVVTYNYYYDQDCYPPRYYQRIAINRSIEAITQGQDKILLVMATGTGKTLTAFQIVYKLFKSGAKKRVLYLADRNILVDQTIIGDFKPLLDNINKIKNRTADKSREIQFALYQSLTGETEEKKLFKKYSKDYFDLIIIDECHRGSAKDDSAWREILDHFDSATKIGLTATPKETKVVSNSDYFGDAIFTYSLKKNNKRMAKSIFFCVDIDHANRMRRALANEVPDEEEEEIDEPLDGEDGETIYPETGDDIKGDGFINDPFGKDDKNSKGRKKYIVNDVQVMVINDRVMYYGADGKLITESLVDYTKKNIRKEFATLDEFLRKWTETEKKEELRLHLEEEGIFLEDLEEEVGCDMVEENNRGRGHK